MKRAWFLCLAVLLLLTGCGQEQPAPTAPWTLEVEYGDSGVEAERGSVTWENGETRLSEEAEPPFDRLSEIPFVNQTDAKEMKLLFDQKPDSLTVRRWTSEDGYQQAAEVELSRSKLPAPTDGASYLYEVQAVWEQGKKAAAWGSCTYYFRYLPGTASGDQSTETRFYRLVQLEPDDLFGVEFQNFLDNQTKTCRSDGDKQAILDYLKAHLSTNFREIELPEMKSDYGLRLAATDGTQYTFEYGGEGKNAWIAIDGKVYEAGVMDLYTLWKGLEAGAEGGDESWKEDYLAVSETDPADGWEQESLFGYVRSLEDLLTYDEILWITDEENPDLYTLERGQLGQKLSIREDAQFWILKDHAGPWCQVPREQLARWAEEARDDVLFRIYLQDGKILAMVETFLP